MVGLRSYYVVPTFYCSRASIARPSIGSRLYDSEPRRMRKFAVFGYGAVGRETTALLTARGDSVRIVQRYKPQQVPSGGTFQFADSTDREATITACAGVDTVICCI